LTGRVGSVKSVISGSVRVTKTLKKNDDVSLRAAREDFINSTTREEFEDFVLNYYIDKALHGMGAEDWRAKPVEIELWVRSNQYTYVHDHLNTRMTRRPLTTQTCLISPNNTE
jgi:hypothetical protein